MSPVQSSNVDSASPVLTPASSGEPLVRGKLKVHPADFIVRERLDIEFDNAGEHLYLHIRKCGLNSSDVAADLLKIFACNTVDLGYCGLKDKHAITDQWFSIRTTQSEIDVGLATIERNNNDHNGGGVAEGEFRVISSARHSRKLKRGAHKGNDFAIVLRDVESLHTNDEQELRSLLHDRFDHIKTSGFANYFGPQRFGFNYQNVKSAERLFAQNASGSARGNRKITRTKRGLYLSAARSHLFNRVCAERINNNTWSTPLLGEPLLLDGTNSFFVNGPVTHEDSSGEASGHNSNVDARHRNFDIHTTGPLWGRGEPIAKNDVLLFEQSVLADYALIKSGLEQEGLKQQRRSLRARVSDLSWSLESADELKLEFYLAKGVYATSFIAEIAECN